MTPRHLLEPGRLAGSALLKAQSDDRLVDMTRSGNDRAFEAIVSRYKSPLLRYCTRILPDGRGEDAVQQAFLNAYNALHRGVEPQALRSWLFGIAHNVSLTILRQRGSAHEQLEPDQVTAEAADKTVERGERLREVLTAVAELPQGQRDAIVLRELAGRGHDEIARELGVTGGAARQLISRARNGVRSAAAAVFPLPLVMRVTDASAAPLTGARVAELTAAGGGVTVAKVLATAAVGGTLISGAVKAPDVVRDRDSADDAADVATAEAAETEPESGDGAGSTPSAEQEGGSGRRGGDDKGDERDRSSHGDSGGGGDDDNERDDDNDSRGHGGGDDDDERDERDPEDQSGSDDEDRSGKSDEDGPEVDEDGPEIDEDGPEVDEDGPEIDQDGPEVDEDGPEIDDDGPEVDEDNSGPGSSGSSGSDLAGH
jgi:RNA polymerase sigma factor (sigma-70 family)